MKAKPRKEAKITIHEANLGGACAYDLARRIEQRLQKAYPWLKIETDIIFIEKVELEVSECIEEYRQDFMVDVQRELNIEKGYSSGLDEQGCMKELREI